MNAPVLSPSATTTAVRIDIRGQVQGIGLRPAVARLAASLHLVGHVENQTEGVAIHVEGPAAAVAAFEEHLPESLPDAAVVARIFSSSAALLEAGEFRIRVGSTGGTLATPVPRDLAVCDRCLKDLTCDSDRRQGYAFTSCTDCGPRYSVIETMPYERDGTSMRDFPLCPACSAEFTSPADRRFHAQTNACPACGPSLWARIDGSRANLAAPAAIDAAASILRSGGMIAIKGIGGYQLLCDATCRDAVLRVRSVKQRHAKPLAVMRGDDAPTSLSKVEQDAFESQSNPIVVVSREVAAEVAPEVSPELNTLGIMRPSSPLHWALLHETSRPLVVTSGNTDGKPLAFDETVAEEDLEPHADLLLQHDRRIVRPIDDSVVRVIADRAVTIRCGRGLAPLPLDLPDGPPMLAVGGHQKVALAICNGEQSVLGPHIGDLDSVPLRERFVQQTRDLLQLYGVEPEFIVHDLHPDYFTTRWAQDQHRPTLGVQHHHAHIVAGMLEHRWLDRPVLGIAFDGTGWGPDGTIWGGEFLRATAAGYQRVGSLLPFVLPGGERAILQPWRVALTLLTEACGVDVAVETLQRIGPRPQLEPVLSLIRRASGPRTSSLGRLFDAVAVLILAVRDSSYEGEAAMRLESACDPAAAGEYSLPVLRNSTTARLDWRLLVQQLQADLRHGVAPGVMAMRFHRAIAAAVSQVIDDHPGLPVVLSGGCFQNRVLTELIADRLSGRSEPVGLPGMIPPNDGGLAAGQLAIGRARLQKSATGREREVPPCA